MFFQIEVTTHCSFTCFYCAGRDMPQRHMGWPVFERVLEHIEGERSQRRVRPQLAQAQHKPRDLDAVSRVEQPTRSCGIIDPSRRMRILAEHLALRIVMEPHATLRLGHMLQEACTLPRARIEERLR